ncbi:hypothetical protein, partial [Helicobacter bilis]|uniref:hypothetical protein n=1 Tax=Helicobacter bilis TaxID=37372 RepID=UPI0026EB4661
FIADTTLFDLQQELSKKYKYYFDGSDEFKAWRDTELDKTKANDKDFNETLRKEFNDNFTFLRQCYADITEPFFIWVKNIKNRDNDYLKSKIVFDEFESLFNEFIESSYSNLDSIEGFFGFGPYHTSIWNNYKYDRHDTGGKVFQNNHWNDEFKEKAQDEYEKIKDEFKNKYIPRIPLSSKDKQYLMHSLEHYLTTMRPLKTFQNNFSEIIEINQNEYEKIAKQVLFHTLLSSDSIRQNAVIFSNKKNEFKNYKVVGNSCVDFVMDKLRLIGASKFDKATTIIPYEVRIHVRDNKPNFYNKQKGKYKKPLSKYDKISYLLQDINLFYQNYATLCQIDSTWDCEKGLNAFCLCYANLITLDNYIFPLTFNEEHTKALGDTKHLRENQIPFAFEKELLNIKQEYDNYQQACSINGDTPLTFNAFKLNIKQDDLARRVNTGIYIANELKDIKTKMHEDSKISLLIFHHEKERFGIANADNDFSYQDFDLSHIDSTTNMASYAYAIKRNSLVVANNLKYYGNITQESMQTYIKVMVAKASEKFNDSHDTISLAKAYYTQQEKDNA